MPRSRQHDLRGDYGVTGQGGRLGDGQLRQRRFRVKGGLRFQERQVSSFDVTCKATAEARADIQMIDRAAAEACRKEVQKTLKKDLEMMD